MRTVCAFHISSSQGAAPKILELEKRRRFSHLKSRSLELVTCIGCTQKWFRICFKCREQIFLWAGGGFYPGFSAFKSWRVWAQCHQLLNGLSYRPGVGFKRRAFPSCTLEYNKKRTHLTYTVNFTTFLRSKIENSSAKDSQFATKRRFLAFFVQNWIIAIS